jgi:hypothetical protein
LLFELHSFVRSLLEVRLLELLTAEEIFVIIIRKARMAVNGIVHAMLSQAIVWTLALLLMSLPLR